MDGRLSRRALLGAGAATGVAALVVGCSDNGDGGSASAGDSGSATHRGRSWVDHLGAHQPGITTPAPEHVVLAGFDTTATDADELRRFLQALADETDALASQTIPTDPNDLLPPPDNGILGFTAEPDDLTITLGIGAALFDERFGLADRKPTELIRMPVFPNDEPHPDSSHGDLLLQICGGTEDTVTHALRRLMRATRAGLTLRWMANGFVRPNTLTEGQVSTRNLLGFKDGTANPSPTSDELMDELVWVQPGDDEPSWAAGGTYQVVRVIRNHVEFWDRTALRTQELIMGRRKESGAPLDGEDEVDVPHFDQDPDGTLTPLTAHIRLANPRTAATEKNRILRRGYNYANGFTADGQLDQGLLFVCFQRSLNDGFMTVQTRLNGEALEEYIRPVGGGFFFVPPGRSKAGEMFAAGLFR
ncbi:MAG: iron uptake transporter deferrochelatase/peroxidase subunit [Ilumatobacteraceae bacterium]